MASPVNGGNQGNGFDQLKAQIQAWIKDGIANALRGGIGMHLDGETGNLIIDQGEIQSGNYAPGSAGWAQTPDGNAEFNSLTLRTGIIGDNALANPTAFGFGGSSAQNFSIGTSAAAKTSVGIPVPAGFTRALIHVTVNASAQNTASVYDYLYVSASITLPNGSLGGSGGDAMDGIAAGEWGNAGASAAGSYTGLTPGSIVVACNARCGSGWTAQSANIANVDATVTFLR